MDFINKPSFCPYCGASLIDQKSQEFCETCNREVKIGAEQDKEGAETYQMPQVSNFQMQHQQQQQQQQQQYGESLFPNANGQAESTVQQVQLSVPHVAQGTAIPYNQNMQMVPIQTINQVVVVQVPGMFEIGLTQNIQCAFCSNFAVSICSWGFKSFNGCGKTFCRDHGHPHFNYAMIQTQQRAEIDQTAKDISMKKHFKEINTDRIEISQDIALIRFCNECEPKFQQNCKTYRYKKFGIWISIISLMIVLLIIQGLSSGRRGRRNYYGYNSYYSRPEQYTEPDKCGPYSSTRWDYHTVKAKQGYQYWKVDNCYNQKWMQVNGKFEIQNKDSKPNQYKANYQKQTNTTKPAYDATYGLLGQNKTKPTRRLEFKK